MERRSRLLSEAIRKEDSSLAAELDHIWAEATREIYTLDEGRSKYETIHCFKVENNLSLLLHDQLRKFKGIDLFVLSAAAALHDIGSTEAGKGYEDHGQLGKRILLEKDMSRRFFAGENRLAIAVAEIIGVHSNGRIGDLREEPFIIDHPPGLLLRSLASIFRLADMLDVNYDRCPALLGRIRYSPDSSLDQSDLKSWIAKGCIERWDFSADRKRLLMRTTCKDNSDRRFAEAFVELLNECVTDSQKRYLRSCPTIYWKNGIKRDVISFPFRFDLNVESNSLLELTVDRIGHVPKADDLFSLRDMLYIVDSKGGVMETEELLKNINKLLLASKFVAWANPTFNEYILLMTYLDLAYVTDRNVKLNPEVITFLHKAEWRVQQPLDETEKAFFRSRLLEYGSLLRFLEIVFCGGKHFDQDPERIIEESSAIRGRTELLHRYMDYFELDDDRDARAFLTWSLQSGIAEKDEYSNTYFLTHQKRPFYENFVKSLVRNYREVYDRDLRRAIIPDLRIATCTDLHISLRFFDEMLEVVEQKNPQSISMDKATAVRREVEEYGIRRKGFYYYYVRLVEEDLR